MNVITHRNEITPEMIMNDIIVRTDNIVCEKEKIENLNVKVSLAEDLLTKETYLKISGEFLDIIKYYDGFLKICNEFETCRNQSIFLLEIPSIDFEYTKFAAQTLYTYETSGLFARLHEVRCAFEKIRGLTEAYADYIEFKHFREKEEVRIMPLE